MSLTRISASLRPFALGFPSWRRGGGRMVLSVRGSGRLRPPQRNVPTAAPGLRGDGRGSAIWRKRGKTKQKK